MKEGTTRVLKFERHPTYPALGLHQRGLFNRPCFAVPDPEEEGPRGGGPRHSSGSERDSRTPVPARTIEAEEAIDLDDHDLQETNPRLPPLAVNLDLPPELLTQLGPLKDVILRLVDMYVSAYMDAIREGPITALVTSHAALNDSVSGDIEIALERLGALEKDLVIDASGQPVMADYVRDTKTGRYILNEDGSPKLFKNGRPFTRSRRLQVELEVMLLRFVESLFAQRISGTEQALAQYHQAMDQLYRSLQATEGRLAESLARVERLAAENTRLARENAALGRAASDATDESRKLRATNDELRLKVTKELDRMLKDVARFEVELDRLKTASGNPQRDK